MGIKNSLWKEISQVWWYITVITELRRLRFVDCFKLEESQTLHNNCLKIQEGEGDSSVERQGR